MLITGTSKVENLIWAIMRAWNHYHFANNKFRFQEPLETNDFRDRVN
jgi:hypothetical protein